MTVLSTEPPAADAPARPPLSRATSATSLRVPASIQIKMREHCTQLGGTHADLMITALDWCYQRHNLADLVSDASSAGGGLFQRRATRARPASDPLVGVSARFLETDYPVIDRLVTSSGARSRGHLMTVVLSTYFQEMAQQQSTEKKK